MDLKYDKRDIVLTCEGHEWKIGLEVRSSDGMCLSMRNCFIIYCKDFIKILIFASYLMCYTAHTAIEQTLLNTTQHCETVCRILCLAIEDSFQVLYFE